MEERGSRKGRIASNLQKIRDRIAETGMEGMLLTEKSNVTWVTAAPEGGDGAFSILVTRREAFAICGVDEEPLLRFQEGLPEAGFGLLVSRSGENLLPGFVLTKVSSLASVVSDAPVGEAVVDGPLVSSCREG